MAFLQRLAEHFALGTLLPPRLGFCNDWLQSQSWWVTRRSTSALSTELLDAPRAGRQRVRLRALGRHAIAARGHRQRHGPLRRERQAVGRQRRPRTKA
eukprot:scaffold3308_cov57-Phaeocystis_antarctica.AAC.2